MTFLDLLLSLFHGSLILFNLAGWASKKTQRIHLITTGLTVLSWFGLGFFYGFGYCPCTDWHWQVKRNLGETNLPDSYIKYFADNTTGLSWNPVLVDSIVLIIGLLTFGLSCWLNLKNIRNKT